MQIQKIMRVIKEGSLYIVPELPGLALKDLTSLEDEIRGTARFFGYEWKEPIVVNVEEGKADRNCETYLPLYESAYRKIAESMNVEPETIEETDPLLALVQIREKARMLYEEGIAKYGITHVPNPFFFGKNKELPISKELSLARIEALKEGIPTMEDEVLDLLIKEVRGKKRVLEIGTAVGITASVMASLGATVVTVEKDEKSYQRANELFQKLNLSVASHLGDAMEFVQNLEGEYDFILLDGPKVQYIKYLPYLKEHLSVGGTLFADDILLFGWVNGKNEVPKKRQALVRHIREYLDAVELDKAFDTTIYEIGEGVAVSRKLW